MSHSKYLSSTTSFTKILISVILLVFSFIGLKITSDYRILSTLQKSSTRQTYVSGEIIVGFNSDVTFSQAKYFLDEYNLTYREPFKLRKFPSGEVEKFLENEQFGEHPVYFLVNVILGQENNMIIEIKKSSLVKFAELNGTTGSFN